MSALHPDTDTELAFHTGRLLGRPTPEGWGVHRVGADGCAYMHPEGLRVIVSVAREGDGLCWLHVSASYSDRIPSYGDMASVKAAFIGKDSYAYSVWAPRARHVNFHPHCLHLWHCLNGEPLPDFTRGSGSI